MWQKKSQNAEKDKRDKGKRKGLAQVLNLGPYTQANNCTKMPSLIKGRQGRAGLGVGEDDDGNI